MTPMTTMYSVCPDCRMPRSDDGRPCQTDVGAPQSPQICGSTRPAAEAFMHMALAEAAAAGMWLAEGYCMQDIRDPYFRPRR